MNRRYADKEMCWKKPKEKTYWRDIVQNYALYKNYLNFFYLLIVQHNKTLFSFPWMQQCDQSKPRIELKVVMYNNVHYCDSTGE